MPQMISPLAIVHADSTNSANNNIECFFDKWFFISVDLTFFFFFLIFLTIINSCANGYSSNMHMVRLMSFSLQAYLAYGIHNRLKSTSIFKVENLPWIDC